MDDDIHLRLPPSTSKPIDHWVARPWYAYTEDPVYKNAWRLSEYYRLTMLVPSDEDLVEMAILYDSRTIYEPGMLYAVDPPLHRNHYNPRRWRPLGDETHDYPGLGYHVEGPYWIKDAFPGEGWLPGVFHTPNSPYHPDSWEDQWVYEDVDIGQIHDDDDIRNQSVQVQLYHRFLFLLASFRGGQRRRGNDPPYYWNVESNVFALGPGVRADTMLFVPPWIDKHYSRENLMVPYVNPYNPTSSYRVIAGPSSRQVSVDFTLRPNVSGYKMGDRHPDVDKTWEGTALFEAYDNPSFVDQYGVLRISQMPPWVQKLMTQTHLTHQEIFDLFIYLAENGYPPAYRAIACLAGGVVATQDGLHPSMRIKRAKVSEYQDLEKRYAAKKIGHGRKRVYDHTLDRPDHGTYDKYRAHQ